MKGNNFSIDQKQYLQEMIFDYDQKLNTNSWSDFHTFIQEEQLKCKQYLKRIREIDMEAKLMEKTSVCIFQRTDSRKLKKLINAGKVLDTPLGLITFSQCITMQLE